jgi:hypothetical protein
MNLRNNKVVIVVVIVIIIILLISGWKFFSSYIPYDVAKNRARDLKRIADLQNFRTALMLYHIEHKKYPNKLSDLVPRYLSEIPLDPREGEPHNNAVCESVIKKNTFSYYYEVLEAEKKFTMSACLEEGKILTISSKENE